MKIAVYGLAYNMSDRCEAWLNTVKDADYIIIGDIGSQDDTKYVLEDLGVTVCDLSLIRPWRYDVARNALLTKIPDDCDVVIACDLNQELISGWRSIISSNWIDGTNKIKCKWQPFNEAPIWSDKIHTSKGYKWQRQVYEILDINPTEQVVFIDQLLIKDVIEFKYGNWDTMLHEAVKESPNDAELLWRLSVLYSVQQRWDDSIVMHKKTIATGDTPMFKSKSMIYLSGLVQPECLSWLMRAAAEVPWRKEVWAEISYYFYNNFEWEACVGNGIKALQLANHRFATAHDISWYAYTSDVISIAAWNCGMKETALKYAEIAANLAPNDQRLQNNYAAVKNSVNISKIDGE